MKLNIALFNIYRKEFFIILCIFFLFLYINICRKANINTIWIDFLNINKRKDLSVILFYPFIGCGYANKIPTLLSSILLSLLSFHPIYIVNWNHLLFYFNFPKELFIQRYNITNVQIYNRKNVSVLRLLIFNISLIIYTYHGFINSVLHYYNLTYNLKLILTENRKEYKTLEMLLNSIFLKPSIAIKNYIYYFKKYRKREYVIGVHIRTGYLSDFGESDRRFFDNNSISKYIKTINNEINKINNSKLFFISDSTAIKKYFYELYKNNVIKYSVPGKICHARGTMHGKVELNDCVVKLISENYILSECNTVIGSKKSSYFGMACKRKIIKCIGI